MAVRIRRRLGCCIIGIAIGGVVFAIAVYARIREREDVIADIRERGGEVILGLSEWESIRQGVNPFGDAGTKECVVQLTGAKFTGQWLQEHKTLDALPITHLFVHETFLTGSDVAALLTRHRLVDVNAKGLVEADVFARASSGCEMLAVIYLCQSDLSDVGMCYLPLESVGALDISRTAVGEVGCAELGRAARLTDLCIDDVQLTARVASLLSTLPSLQTLALVGAGVDDADLTGVERISGLRYLYCLDTSVTPGGVEHIRGVLSQCEVVVDE